MKVIYTAFMTVLVLWVIWVLLSFADIIADNNYPNPVHHEYNFFTVVFGDE